jgi:hypothetical protein
LVRLSGIPLSRFIIDGKIVEEAERDLPTTERPSWISLNGRWAHAVARRRHKLLFPESRLRVASVAAWVGAGACLIATLAVAERVFHL